MMAPKAAEIDIAIFIILTDFVTFNKYYVLNKKPARNRQILAHNSSGLDSLNYKTSCIYHIVALTCVWRGSGDSPPVPFVIPVIPKFL